MDPGFSERDLNIEVISELGCLRVQLPEATGYFINIALISCLMQDLESVMGATLWKI